MLTHSVEEYLSAPLLVDPAEADIAGGAGSAKSGLGAGKKVLTQVQAWRLCKILIRPF